MININIGRFFKYIIFNWIQITLIILSIYDLRIELRLLFDALTFTQLFYSITEHPLAVTVLLTIPYLFNNLSKNNH